MCGPILIVDDESDIRESFRDILEVEGYAVVTANHGQHGLEVLATIPRPCITLLDLMMPVMNGLDFLAELRTTGPRNTIPVVLITAVDGMGKQAIGAAGVLKQPIPVHVLLDCVAQHCRARVDHGQA